MRRDREPGEALELQLREAKGRGLPFSFSLGLSVFSDAYISSVGLGTQTTLGS